MYIYLLFFFFSSRRRHTRLVSDWSSDVCSSDLPWGDTASITVTPEKPSEFAFYLRIPGWSDRTQVTVNGKAISGVTEIGRASCRESVDLGDGRCIEKEQR